MLHCQGQLSLVYHDKVVRSGILFAYKCSTKPLEYSINDASQTMLSMLYFVKSKLFLPVLMSSKNRCHHTLAAKHDRTGRTIKRRTEKKKEKTCDRKLQNYLIEIRVSIANLRV